jgi:signal transduction histidine kinase
MNKLWIRLSLGFSGVVLAAVFVVALTGYLVGRSDPRGDRFAASKRLALELETYYEVRHSWTGSEQLLIGAQTMFDKRAERSRDFFLTDAEEHIIYHPRAEQIGKPVGQTEPIELIPIQSEGQTIGYLGLDPVIPREPEGSSNFVAFLGRALLTVAVVVGISGIVFGIVMSRSLTAPFNNLAAAAKAIGARNLDRRVEEKGSDELIAVARSFNEMADALEQAEQLRRSLLADVAHELRTPLSILQGNLRAILDEVYPLDQSEMARLYEHTRSLSRLVNDLHELAQAEAKQLPPPHQDTALAHLARTTVEGFRPGADEKGVTLDTNLPPSSPTVPVDPGRLTQVLQNLLANALRHTPTGGKITLYLEAKPEAIHLAVADTGDGIPAEQLPHIFDRFYRTDPARSRDQGGAGLGLAIARAIVEAHGGQIAVTSEGTPGTGSTFTIQLPFKQSLFTSPSPG